MQVEYRQPSQAEMYQVLKPSQFIVAVGQDTIIGCIRTVQVESDCKEMASLVVDPNYRNQGIGSKLIQKVLEKDDERPLYLICDKKRTFLYQNHGFTLIPVKNIPKTLKRDVIKIRDNDPNIVVMVSH
jgi:N-acetylglutamate synthase-like GNAT family acetyltransferase